MTRSEGVNATSRTDVRPVYPVCQQYLIFDRVVVGAGGRDDTASLQRSLTNVSEGFLSALQLGASIHLSDRVHDATKLFSVFVFSAPCSCFRHATRPKVLA